MSFIKEFNHTNITINYSETFLESNEHVTYSVGSNNNGPTILATDHYGEKLWQLDFELQYTNPETFRFNKIIQITEVNQDVSYVLSFSGSGDRYGLLKINHKHEIVWVKAVGDIIPFEEETFLVNSRVSSDFYFCYSALNEVMVTQFLTPHVIRFNTNGTVLNAIVTYTSSGDDLLINSVYSYEYGLAVLATHKGAMPNIIDFDYELTKKHQREICYGILPFGNFKAHDILVYPTDNNNNVYVVSGYDVLSDVGVLLRVTDENDSPQLHALSGSATMKITLCKQSGNHFYAVGHEAIGTNTLSTVYYCALHHTPSQDFDYLWAKNIGTKGGYLLKRLNYLPFNNSVTGFDIHGEYLVYAASDLLTCETNTLSRNISLTDGVPIKERSDSFQANITFMTGVKLCETDLNPGEGEFICAPSYESIDTGNISLQSPNLIFSAAGSTGADGSAAGVHLRWMFGRSLGEKHLPKGDYSQNTNNFNKPDDFVTVYRARYQENFVNEIDFANSQPLYTYNQIAMWVYPLSNGEFIHVYFRNQVKYHTLLPNNNSSPSIPQFFQDYGDEIIEIVSKRNLFFNAKVEVSGVTPQSVLRVEALSVNENLETAPKITYARKTYSGSSANTAKMLCENGRSIRLKATSCLLSKIKFEFYSEFIERANSQSLWQNLGNYALSQEDATALTNLEPVPGLINGKWPLYNDGDTVNIANYVDKWNNNLGEHEKSLSALVDKFLELSEFEDNPQGMEPSDSEEPEEVDPDYSMSLLNMINLAANDYHIARLLGLGMIDYSNGPSGVKYIYLTKYTTEKNVNNIAEFLNVTHVAMSLPLSASTNDQRLPKSVDIDKLTPGIINPDDMVSMTAPEGYSHDGLYRYVTISAHSIPNLAENEPFYMSDEQYNMKDFSYPVYAGLEYKMDAETVWRSPELSHDEEYRYAAPIGQTGDFETQPILLSDITNTLFIHKQTKSGRYYYNSYGINIFSRPSAMLLPDKYIDTHLKPANLLKPPSNVTTVFIREESPLVFTSADEQDMLIDNPLIATDNTLVRLTFDYNFVQEVSVFKIDPIFTDSQVLDVNGPYSSELEYYANDIEIYIRNYIPNTVSGRAMLLGDVTEDVSEIATSAYFLASINETLEPIIPAGTAVNYVGGMFVCGDQQFVIKAIDVTGQYPKIQVYKKQISDVIVNPSGEYINYDSLQGPENINGALFTIVENMQNIYAWGANNPHTLKINLPDWEVRREIYGSTDDEGNTDKYLEKSRGFWDDGTIEEVMEPTEETDINGNLIDGHRGLYKVTFDSLILPQHPQYEADHVNYYKGIVRVRTINGGINSERKICDVVKIENIGSTTDAVILYFTDPSFEEGNPSYDRVETGHQDDINFYPGYRVYLYHNDNIGLNAEGIQPSDDEDVKYSIFGLRSHSINDFQTGGYFSRMSTPSILYVQKIIAPKQPDAPVGSIYATRPDFYGKSTYTFQTHFKQRPHAILFYRADEELILNALYKPETVTAIKTELDSIKLEDEEIFNALWVNFLDFGSLAKPGHEHANYTEFANSYSMPWPDNPALINGIEQFVTWHNTNNGGNIAFEEIEALNQVIIPQSSGIEKDVLLIHFIQEAVESVFVPLTELPLIYEYIKPNAQNSEPYEPNAQKQQVRDKNGHLLNPLSSEFHVAPMAKVVEVNTVEFTDFTLDGASGNMYFYGAREMGTQLKMGPFSQFIGPVKLVNTYPAYAPEIRKVISLLDAASGELPALSFEINEYDKRQQMAKINLYRAFNRLDSESIRSMALVKRYVIDSPEVFVSDGVWAFSDDFSDLAETPYGETAYYRITVSREVKYSEYSEQEQEDIIVTEYAPSLPSKIVAFVLPEPVDIVSPILNYIYDTIQDGVMQDVTLYWNKTIYNGIYHLYKMNAEGTWKEIFSIQSNDESVYVSLGAIAEFTSNLNLLDNQGRQVYHHFKVIAESPAGKISRKENIRTIFEENIIPGIGEMGIDTTFMVRPNNN